jgi:hypothetical protein
MEEGGVGYCTVHVMDPAMASGGFCSLLSAPLHSALEQAAEMTRLGKMKYLQSIFLPYEPDSVILQLRG